MTQICGLVDLVRERLAPVVETEEQMLYIFHLVGETDQGAVLILIPDTHSSY